MTPLQHSGLVLLVEDDENDAFFFQRAFTKAGYTNPIHVACDGQEAMDYLSGAGAYADRAQFPLPEWVVMDLNMPRRNGIDVLKWIRAHPTLNRLVVVVLTSSCSDADIEATYSLKVNSYLMKPSESDRFASTVQLAAGYWLGLNRSPSAQAPAATPLPNQTVRERNCM